MDKTVIIDAGRDAQPTLAYPFTPSSSPFKNMAAVEEFLGTTLRLTPLKVVECRARFTNILLGRQQEPTVIDAIYSAELIKRAAPFERFDFSARWEDTPITWPQNDSTEPCRVLQLRVHEKIAGTVNAPIGYLRFAVRGAQADIETIYLGLRTNAFVEELEDYRVFDGLVGFDEHTLVGWSYVVDLARDVRAWAGSEMGDMYDAFLAYARKLIETKRTSDLQVKLVPVDHEQVQLTVKVHRGPFQLAGFTTMAEFDEVLTKEKH